MDQTAEINSMFHRDFMDLGKLNFLMGVWFQAQANFHCCPSSLKNDNQLKSCKIRLKNNHLDLIILIRNTLCRSGVNFINVLGTNFSYERHFGSLFYVLVTREKLPKQISYKKFSNKTLMKLTPILLSLFKWLYTSLQIKFWQHSLNVQDGNFG